MTIRFAAVPRPSRCLTLAGVLSIGAAAIGQGWTQLNPSTAPGAREHGVMVTDEERETILLFGGDGGTLSGLADTWEWNGSQWLQRNPAVSPPARWGHGMTYDSRRRRIVLFGGNAPGGTPRNDTWEWDGTNWTQRTPANPPGPRAHHGFVFDSARGNSVCFGGRSGSSALGDTWTWNGAQWTLASTPVSPSPRSEFCMTYVANDHVVVLEGGRNQSSQFGDTWSWNGNSWQLRWTGGFSLVGGVFSHRTGMAFGFGGSAAAGQSLGACTWPGTSQWEGWTASATAGGSPPSARSGQMVAYDRRAGELLVFGGRDATGIRNDTWALGAFQSSGDGWSRFPSRNQPVRDNAAMVYDSARGQMLVHGGREHVWPAYQFYDSMLLWTGGGWIVHANTLQERARHRIVDDVQRGRLVMFGGDNATGMVPETFEWNGASWAMVASTGPQPRTGHGMTYDLQRGKVVLFGGDAQNVFLGDTWEWDGSSWLQSSPANSPSPRETSIAYDPSLGRTVLFGGFAANSSWGTVGDTWEWDGLNWSSVPGAAPQDRGDHHMAFDSARGAIILWGGMNWLGGGFNEFSDTWERTGSTWTRVATGWPQGPGPRHGAALAYHPIHRGVLVMGDTNGNRDTWCRGTSGTSADAIVFGAGCGTPELRFTPTRYSRPLCGATFRGLIENGQTQLAFVALGTSSRLFGSQSIPFSLSPFGAPGCSLWQSTDFGLMFPTTGAVPGAFFADTAIPFASVLLGVHLYLQAWSLAPNANAAGVIVSNGIDLRIGNL